MNEEHKEPVRSVCGISFAALGWITIVGGAVTGMVIGGNYRYGAGVGWLVFGYCFGAGMVQLAISTALHFLARIAAATEHTAEVDDENRKATMQREPAARQTPGCDTARETIEQIRQRVEAEVRRDQAVASFTKP